MSAIYGIGTDIVEVSRLTHSIQRHGQRFLEKLFLEGECAYCETLQERAKYQSYAARFAAKEAISKALRQGIGPAFDWTELEIYRLESGAPLVKTHGRANAFIEKEGISDIHLSMSHCSQYATAYAVAEKAL